MLTGQSLTFEDLAFPEHHNLRRIQKTAALDIFAVFVNFIENVSPGNRTPALFRYHFENIIHF
jgi:hypothetical protein